MRRLLSAALVVVMTSMIVFALFFLGPNNPAQPLCDLNGKCTPEKLCPAPMEALAFRQELLEEPFEAPAAALAWWWW